MPSPRRTQGEEWSRLEKCIGEYEWAPNPPQGPRSYQRHIPLLRLARLRSFAQVRAPQTFGPCCSMRSLQGDPGCGHGFCSCSGGWGTHQTVSRISNSDNSNKRSQTHTLNILASRHSRASHETAHPHIDIEWSGQSWRVSPTETYIFDGIVELVTATTELSIAQCHC